ncbi:MAG: hypothetical protein RL722_1704 [Pseudomonadota bacterium]|jgi:phosphoribosylformimino-5-aminoimidazole carboxamide ribotide isomerase
MFIVPVIDLMGGQAVHARRGDRQHYAPIQSRLVAGSAPVAVTGALLQAAATAQAALAGRLAAAGLPAAVSESAEPRLYIADLDALQGRPAQLALVAELLDAYPRLHVWLDAGLADAQAAAQARACFSPGQSARLKTLYASEALASAQALAACCGGEAGRQAILSLDQRGAQKMDPAGCWQRPELWPDDLIVMTLERVGAGSGPALDVLAQVQASARSGRAAGQPLPRLWGAGGVRDLADLVAATQAGASGWLIATALHEGTLV